MNVTEHALLLKQQPTRRCCSTLRANACSGSPHNASHTWLEHQVIEVSLTEPHTSELNRNFFMSESWYTLYVGMVQMRSIYNT